MTRTTLTILAGLGLTVILQVSAATTVTAEPVDTGVLADSATFADSVANVFNEDGSLTDLDDVVVTATRTPKSLKDVPVVTRLITSEELKKADATNIQDLLTEELPGLEFGFSMSQETSLNMSGFGGNAILFLVDGERLAGETLDNVDYNRLNLNNVGQVEIVKGASSALYGANAVGGVVNLISKESTEPWHANVNARYKSFGKEWRYGGDISFNHKQWNSNTSVQYNRSDNVQLASPLDTKSSLHNIYGGHSLNIKERLTYRPIQTLRLIARGGYFDRVSDRVNYEDHYKDYSAGLRGVWNITGDDNLELSYSYDQYDKSRYVSGKRTHDHDYSNRQNIAHGLYSHFWDFGTLTVGADYMHDYLTSYQFVDNGVHTQYSLDAFAQFDWRPLNWFNVIASVRQDYFSGSKEGSPTARLALMFKPELITVRASYAGGFRAPSLKEMFMNFDMAGIQMIYGNPDLRSEKSHNFNLSFERNGAVGSSIFAGAYSLTATGTYTYYISRITTTDYIAPDGEEGARYANEDDVKVAGLDIVGRYRFKCGVGLKASYNYIHTWGRKIDSQFSQQRPHSATWRVDYERSFNKYYRFYAGLSGRYLGRPDTQRDNSGAYSIWKFSLEQEVWRGVNINFAIDNLFNYKPKVYYWNSAPTDGISWSIGLSLNINDMLGK